MRNKKWEYYIVGLDNAVRESDILSDLGKDGWELCTLYVIDQLRRYYFKREIIENKLEEM